MFDFFQRKRQRRASADIQLTLSNTFKKLSVAASLADPLERQYAVAAALAACAGALRDTYPNFLQHEDSIATAFLEANVRAPIDEAAGLCDAIVKTVQSCPTNRHEQIASVLWMLSPTMGHAARNGLFAK